METNIGPNLTEVQQDAIRRLRCTEGHTRGVARMVESGADCVAVVRQIKAVQGALDKVAQMLLYQHLELLIPNSLPADDRDYGEELVVELADLFGLGRTE
jgi:DNA-binding FrmR family transcriptional regulator